MAALPAVCGTCGRLFYFDRFIGGSGSATVTMTNVTVGPCPHCGGRGSVPDGVYQFAQDIVRYLGSAGLSAADLVTLRTVISEEIAKGEPSAELLSERINEEVPAASGLIRLLNSDASMRLVTWLMFVLTLIGLFVQHSDATGRPVELTPTQVEEIIHAALTPSFGPSPTIRPAPTAYSGPNKRVGRNALCPCGSGRKFKHCCIGK